MKKIIFIISALTFFVNLSFGGENNILPKDVAYGLQGEGQRQKGRFSYSGFTGGMTYHMGYVDGGVIAVDNGQTEVLQNIKGLAKGLGGSLKFHFGNNLRIGGEGYSSSISFGKYGSQVSLSLGGVYVDYVWHRERISPFAGVTVGGGGIKYVILTSPAQDINSMELNSSYSRYGFAAVTPFAGFEYKASRHMRLVFRVDWTANVSRPNSNFPTGPRVHLGFVFSRDSNGVRK